MEEDRIRVRMVTLAALAVTLAVVVWGPAIALATPGGGHLHTYEYVSTPVTWSSADQAARDLGGHLATITSADENAQVFALTGDHWAWLGANDSSSEGNWRWIGGRWFLGGPGNQAAHRYTNWAANEPSNGSGDEDCLMIWSAGTGTWNDAQCDTLMGYVIEWD